MRWRWLSFLSLSASVAWATGTAKSPFNRKAELDFFVETATHYYVVELDLALLYGRPGRSLGDLEDIDHATFANTDQRVWEVDKRDPSKRTEYPAIVEFLADGKSSFAAYRRGSERVYLFVPAPRRPVEQGPLKYSHRSWGPGPEVVVDDVVEKAIFGHAYGANEEVIARLVSFWPTPVTVETYPRWTDAERDALKVPTCPAELDPRNAPQ